MLSNHNFNYESKDKILLRRNNKIKSIWSTCAIEGNAFSFNKARDILNGLAVLPTDANLVDVLEIKNANQAYSTAEKLNPFNEKDLLLTHKILMDGINDQNGKYRLCHEGVFEGSRCIFMAPPPNMVPDLMSNLFNRIKENKDNLSPLIYSIIFHYEFVYIHTFTDGNVRIARIWSMLLLSKLSNLFFYLPLELEIKLHQQEDYDAINSSNIDGDSTAFLSFMLKMILNALNKELNNESSQYNVKAVTKILKVMPLNKEMSAKELEQALNISSLFALKKGYLNQFIDLGFVKPTFPDKMRSPNQKYKRVVSLKLLNLNSQF